MTLSQLNEWWAQDVTSSMKKKGTKGSFTEYCKGKGFRKASYECIKQTIKEMDKILENPKSTDKQRKDALHWKRRAVLARTFKGWNKKKKK